MTVLDEVKHILGEVLQIEDEAQTFSAATPLLGSIPEFDSMSVVALITALEEYYGIAIEDDEINAEIFESVGALVSFIEAKV